MDLVSLHDSFKILPKRNAIEMFKMVLEELTAKSEPTKYRQDAHAEVV